VVIKRELKGQKPQSTRGTDEVRLPYHPTRVTNRKKDRLGGKNTIETDDSGNGIMNSGTSKGLKNMIRG